MNTISIYLRNNRRLAQMLVASLLLCVHSAAEMPIPEHVVESPNGVLKAHFALRDGAPHYRLTRFGNEVIKWSRLGLRFVEGAPLTDGFEIVATENCSTDSSWVQPWGETREIADRFNGLRVSLRQTGQGSRHLDLVFRAYDDGIGFRYEIPGGMSDRPLKISDEVTEFALAEDASCWWIPAFGDNRYEYLYSKTALSQAKRVHTPLTIQSEQGYCVTIHEAALTDYPSMTLANAGELTFSADLVPWSDGVRAVVSAPFVTPWRTVQVADRPADLITSNLILNLNEPSQIEDTSWIKPGKYVGVWWEMHLGRSTWGSGPKHGATTDNVRGFIDFAAEHGIDGVLVEGWNKTWDGDWMQNGSEFSFTDPYDDYDLKELAEYATERGVYLIAHNETGGDVQNYEQQLEQAFSLYRELGIPAVKSGYVAFGAGIPRRDGEDDVSREWHHGQFMVRHYRKVLEAAAEHQIMLIVHEPIKGTGLRRTFPNMMSREGVRGQEYNSGLGEGNPPEHTTILPFTRGLAGPIDFTPGLFDLTFEMADRNGRHINTTLAKQLALYVVLYSPIQMAVDFPEIYRRYPDAFQFIKDVPTDWEETRVLHAEIGNYVAIVRKQRESDDWFLGAITDENGRVLHTPLSFLDRDKTYTAEVYRDADDAHWERNQKAYEVTRLDVDANSVLELKLAPGGGQAIRFTPKKSPITHVAGATE